QRRTKTLPAAAIRAMRLPSSVIEARRSGRDESVFFRDSFTSGRRRVRPVCCSAAHERSTWQTRTATSSGFEGDYLGIRQGRRNAVKDSRPILTTVAQKESKYIGTFGSDCAL